RLAAALSAASGTPFVGTDLPFETFAFVDPSTIRFQVDGARWTCDPQTLSCRRETEDQVEGTASPDGRWAVSVADHNLQLRSVATGEVRVLTDDGNADHAYATPIPSPLEAAGIPSSGGPPAPSVIWSPDSRRLVSYRIDARPAGQFHLVQSTPLNGSLRPVPHSYAYPLPGDEDVPLAEFLICDAETGRRVPLPDVPAAALYYGSPLRPERVWWSEDGRKLYVVSLGRGNTSYALSVVDADTGASRTVVEEQSETGIDPHPAYGGRPIIRVLDGGRGVLWYSQRDGWGHLYLYEGETGALRRQITSGAWAATDVLHVDEQAGLVYFTAVGREPGRDPYFNHLYRVSLDGGEPELLTPDDATHQIAFSPRGTCFVDSYSRVDLPAVTALRAADGSLIHELERADVGRLEQMGWRPPERFRAKARDGVTDVYGVLIRPTWFDAARDGQLPVLDSIYAGPQTLQAPTSFTGYSTTTSVPNKERDFWHAQALAELGFAVVMVDGLGMPFRSRAFADRAYRNLGDGGMPDHVVAIRQLAERHPELDRERVGIYGHSAGGYASAHAMLAFPDFFRVAVSSAGNHDHRLDKATWVERYMGLPVGEHYAAQANPSLAHRLKGKLLLMHGEMDENVHPASTLQLVDALIKANKDFDLLILPNRPHGMGSDPYFVRRRWDYFVRHLLGAEPPHEYAIAAPETVGR
ncbi:MAG TPA: DPP IV N-terminal domain-containing protein, partial [Thermomicrobiaceae bacterium]|nr:DPP IV N-terminal domain-containing protein [Thermomicrobiaceae bacterium]